MHAKILNASAGSGKTYQLAYQYVRDTVEQPSLYRHILAVTFTNKATEEMKSRILKEIHALASGARSAYLDDLCRELRLDAETVRSRAREVRGRILHDYSRFTVLTIDTFFQRILRAFIKELGLDLDYTVEIETASLLARSADALIERIASDRELLRWMTDFVEERIEEGRRWDIREGILALGGELFKEQNRQTLLSARSREELGRIVRRIVGRAEATRGELVATAREAVRRIAEAGLSVDDFPYKRSGFAAWFYTVAEGTVCRYGARVEAACADGAKWGPAGSAAQRLRDELQPLLRRMCAIYDGNLRSWNTAALLRENYRSFALLFDLYAEVNALCDRQNMMLLSETKYILSEFIGRNDAPFIYEKAGNRYDRFMIDEFQDTSQREWENFLPLLRNAMSQSERQAVLLVGDVKQSIYRWRGGDWQILRRGALEALGEERTEVAHLDRNFRSLPQVVLFNNRAMRSAVDTDNAVLNGLISKAAERGDLTNAEAAELHDTLSDAYRAMEQRPVRQAEHPGYVSVETFVGEPALVERICALLDSGFRPSDLMILVRRAADGARIAAELLDFKSRNTDPRYRFDVMTQEALVIGKAPVSGFIAASLRLAVDPDDSLSRAVRNRYLGRPFDEPLGEAEEAFFRSIRLLSPEEAFERIVVEHRLADDRSETAYLQALHEQIISFSASRIADIPLFLRWWEETGAARSLTVEESATTIEISTIHKAKGLEKRVVLIPWCSWELGPKFTGFVRNVVWAEARGDADEVGRFPVYCRTEMADSDFSAEYYRELVHAHVDNVNLLYVALTRAAESLHVFIPQKRAESAGSLLLAGLGHDGDRAFVGDLEGRYSSSEQGERYEFGTFAGPVAAADGTAEVRHVVLEHYPTSLADLRLRLPSERYFDEGAVELAPRNLGIMMHRAFELAHDAAEIGTAVDRMVAEGSLSADEAVELRGMIDRALGNPVVREWFAGGWETVRNEQQIIRPGERSVRRPDRVMTRGDRAVVVDYKFGKREAAAYRQQIRAYASLLGRMGYARVEGYIWYVRLGEVERVEL